MDDRVKPMGKPAGYDPVVAQEILDRIMDGELLTNICTKEGMPTRKAFYGWMEGRDDLKGDYARARLAWADFWAERAIQISLDPERSIEADGKLFVDHAVIGWAKLVTDNIKWLVGKYAPRTYGDKPQEEAAATGEIKITWLSTAAEPPAPPQPPKRLEYKRPELPGDLSPADWSALVDVLELVKRTIPTNSDRPAEEIFGVMKAALLAHFADSPENVV
jgi:hypothetical protein